MIKIDNARIKEKKTQESDELSENNEDIYKFSKSVLQELIEDNIPSIPSNYSIYFEKLLDKKNADFKQKLGDFIVCTDTENTHSEGSINIEKEIKHSFSQIKGMLQAVALIYKNLSIMKVISKKYMSNLQNTTDLLAVQNVLSAFNKDLLKLLTLMDKHIDLIKLNYDEIGRVFKIVEEQAIYDLNFDVYNKKFLINAMQIEAENVKRYGYKSSFLLVKISDKVIRRIQSLKYKNSILKKISQLLLKTSRRSDIVAHYGDGCFCMVMKHTDIEGAKKACNRILKLLYDASYISDGEKLDIEFQMVTCALGREKSMEETFSIALDRLETSTKDEQPVCLNDGV